MCQQDWRIGMNATDFIKEHGVEKARKAVEGAPDLAEYYSTIDGEYYRIEINAVNLKQLKRLVESVDLVDLKGGVKKLKKEADCLFHNEVEGVALRYEQAIADYELIYSDKDTNYGELK
jgi:hypothetical protein